MKTARFFALLLLFYACQKSSDSVIPLNSDLPDIPEYFPEIEYPEDNQYSAERWELGKKLFFDPVMSLDSSLSCSSCHKPELAFADDQSISPGVESRLGNRNAPSLSNVAYHPYYTREGGVPTLEMQVLVPIQEHAEFDYNIVELSERLKRIPEYVAMSQSAYNREMDHFVITRALACFERTLISSKSDYDLYLQTNNPFVLNEQARKGMQLFFSDELACSECHGGFDFTDYSFSNNGLYVEYEDVGRYRLTKDDADLYMFKVPSLRNVALTAPYMHDGSFQSLEEVIDHYNRGGKNNMQKSELIKPLNLTEGEKDDLLAFLHTLTDVSFITNKKFKNNE